MPELPEVTVISEDVAALAVGREVLRAAVFRPDVTNVEPEEFGRRLVGKTLRKTGRRGKIIVLDFGDVVGLVHLVISGRVLRLPGWKEPDRMNTAVLEFGGEGDTRGAGLHAALARLLRPLRAWRGRQTPPHLTPRPRPLLRRFHRRIPDLRPESQGQHKRPAPRPIGSGRPRQHLRRRNPLRRPRQPHAQSQHPHRKRRYRTSTPPPATSCSRAIEARGTTFDSYHDAFGETGKFQHQLKVFTHAGEPCPRCGTEIIKSRVAGRGTHTCLACQN